MTTWTERFVFLIAGARAFRGHAIQAHRLGGHSGRAAPASRAAVLREERVEESRKIEREAGARETVPEFVRLTTGKAQSRKLKVQRTFQQPTSNSREPMAAVAWPPRRTKQEMLSKSQIARSRFLARR